MKKFLLLLVILILPSAFYVFLTAGKEKSFVRLPYYGPKKTLNISEKGKIRKDTAFYHVPFFSFTDQHNNKLSSSSLVDKVWVASFTYLTDKKIAPSMAVLMNRVEERTNLDTALRMLTFALDSSNTSITSSYATMVHAGRRQLFLSGNSQEIKNLAVEGFYNPVDSSYSNGFVYFFLVDKEGCIRGIYNALKVKEVDYMIDDISMMEAAYYIQAQKKNKDKDASDPM
ncbi:MAG TPA: SCO family protein [Bacteroidia bacterium]|nr:SCO family protein [Bacteroidia bacterium]